MKNDLTPAQRNFLIALANGEEITVTAKTLDSLIRKGFVYDAGNGDYDLTDCGVIAVSHLTSSRHRASIEDEEVRVVPRRSRRSRNQSSSLARLEDYEDGYSTSRLSRNYDRPQSQYGGGDSSQMIAMGLGMAVTGVVFLLLEDR